MRFADRVGRIEPSATLAISNKSAELAAQGVDVVDLSVGEPDFETPANIVQAGRASLESGDHGYTPSNGIPELRAAISESFADDGLAYDPAQIVVTPGAKQALFEIVMATVQSGDEVVLLDPAWVSYEAMVRVAGGEPVRVDLAPHAFQLEPALDELAAAVSADTQLVLLNSPSNPSGAVFSEAALEGVRDLAVEHDITVVADEIYREITYVDDYPSLGTLDGMAGRTVTVNGFSKAYAMTGWRLGYYAGPERLLGRQAPLPLGELCDEPSTPASRRSGTPTRPSGRWSRPSRPAETSSSSCSTTEASTSPRRTARSISCSRWPTTTGRGANEPSRPPMSRPSPGARSARRATPASPMPTARRGSARPSTGWPRRSCSNGLPGRFRRDNG